MIKTYQNGNKKARHTCINGVNVADDVANIVDERKLLGLNDEHTVSEGSGIKLYFDYNATTPLEPTVYRVIETAMRDAWGNPSSSHANGIIAKSMIENARLQLSKLINTPSAEDIIFTSGGTESNNMVFYSILNYFKVFNRTNNTSRPHVITSNVEHDSIIKIAQSLTERKLIDLTICEVSLKTGLLSADMICSLVRDNTVLVTLMLANNETGIIQDIDKVSQRLKEINKIRLTNDLPEILIHTDAAQAIGKIPVNVNSLGVDYLTIVGHKFYGPRIGALWVKDLSTDKRRLTPLFYGGGQEHGFRPGTENTPMIAGLGEAAHLITCNLKQYHLSMEKARDYFETQLSNNSILHEKVTFNGRYEGSTRLPNTSNVSFIGENLQGYILLDHCDRIQASVGAACHSHQSTEPSRILIASGITESIAKNAIRISFGRETTLNDVNILIEDLVKAVQYLSRSIMNGS